MRFDGIVRDRLEPDLVTPAVDVLQDAPGTGSELRPDGADLIFGELSSPRPEHPDASLAEARVAALGGPPDFTPAQRLARAERFLARRMPAQCLAELDALPEAARPSGADASAASSQSRIEPATSSGRCQAARSGASKEAA